MEEEKESWEHADEVMEGGALQQAFKFRVRRSVRRPIKTRSDLQGGLYLV